MLDGHEDSQMFMHVHVLVAFYVATKESAAIVDESWGELPNISENIFSTESNQFVLITLRKEAKPIDNESHVISRCRELQTLTDITDVGLCDLPNVSDDITLIEEEQSIKVVSTMRSKNLTSTVSFSDNILSIEEKKTNKLVSTTQSKEVKSRCAEIHMISECKDSQVSADTMAACPHKLPNPVSRARGEFASAFSQVMCDINDTNKEALSFQDVIHEMQNTLKDNNVV